MQNCFKKQHESSIHVLHSHRLYLSKGNNFLPGLQVIIEGNIQHKIGSIFTNADRVESFMQCYFHQEGGSSQNNYFKYSEQFSRMIF